MLPLFDLSLQINGFPIQKAQKDFKKIVVLSEGDYEVFIENKKNTRRIQNYDLSA